MPSSEFHVPPDGGIVCGNIWSFIKKFPDFLFSQHILLVTLHTSPSDAFIYVTCPNSSRHFYLKNNCLTRWRSSFDENLCPLCRVILHPTFIFDLRRRIAFLKQISNENSILHFVLFHKNDCCIKTTLSKWLKLWWITVNR
jgi:hypothetical protein